MKTSDKSPIIEPVKAELIKKELTDECFLRKTNKAGNLIYVVDAHHAPNTMREIARLRELSFRKGGGGSGNEMDMDEFDTMETPYKQLIVWNPDDDEIIGGYRFFRCKKAAFESNGQPKISVCHLFKLSQTFIDDYLPYTIEMSRAFVQPKYQSMKMRMKALFALDNLWDGIGALLAEHNEVKYLIGKVTIYSQVAVTARNAMIYYLNKYFGDKNKLMKGYHAIKLSKEEKRDFCKLFIGEDYKDNLKILGHYFKMFSEKVPPLIHAYIDLSSSMKTFGTCFDPDFGDIYDTGMMITVKDIDAVKRDRYITTYIRTMGRRGKVF